MDNKKYSTVIRLILLISLVSVAFGKQMMIQPWQKEDIQIPSISTTFKTTVNPAQLRLLTKYNSIETAFAELNKFILELPIDSTRNLQMVVEKRPQLAADLDKLIRNKAVITGFEYSSDSSAEVTIALDSKLIIKLFQPYWKPEPIPKVEKVKSPKKVKVAEEAKENKTAIKPEEKKAEPAKPAEPMKPEPKAVVPVTPAPKPIAPVTPNPSPIPDVKKEDKPSKQDSPSPDSVK